MKQLDDKVIVEILTESFKMVGFLDFLFDRNCCILYLFHRTNYNIDFKLMAL